MSLTEAGIEIQNNDKLPSDTKAKVNTNKKDVPSKPRQKGNRRVANKPKAGVTSTDTTGKPSAGSSSNVTIVPSMALTPGAVHSNLLGVMDFIDLMLKRLLSIARRPLITLLAVQDNIEKYKRICNMLFTLRIAAAQDRHPYVRGTTLALSGVYTAVDYKTVDDFCLPGIPTPLAWALSHVGTFKQGEVDIVPNLPYSKESSLITLKHGSFPGICDYVQAHAEGEAGADIPADEQTWLNSNRHLIPTTIVANRFSADTVLLWDNDVNNHFGPFNSINSALKEQNLVTPNIQISAGIGTEAQALRSTTFRSVNNVEFPYYSTLPLSRASIKAGICLRTGIDSYIPQAEHSSRFLCSYEAALLKGNAVPAAFVNEQLDMLNQ